jgi:hypothetical protein
MESQQLSKNDFGNRRVREQREFDVTDALFDICFF